MDSNSIAIIVMVGTFLYLGYQGVPVAFALAAGAFVTTAFFTKISLASMVGQMFNGINSLEFLAIPFFLLAGDMMTAANITERLIRLAQVFVGHFRSGLAHVVSLSSMLFAGISGSAAQSGEGMWTVEAAKELGVPAPVIERALEFRIQSQKNPSYTGKIISALRNQFGGHEAGEKAGTAEGGKVGR